MQIKYEYKNGFITHFITFTQHYTPTAINA